MAYKGITLNMDRLVIETILTDVESVSFNNIQGSLPCISFGFDGTNIEQAKHAFNALKKLTLHKGVSLVICETLVSGMYDFEIVSEAMDEPVRICNKVIDHEVLNRIEEQINQQPEIIIGIKDLEVDSQIHINKASYKVHHTRL
jgi:hypothetical protein